MGEQCPSEVEAPLHRPVQAPLELLRDDLAQHHLFGEVLGAYSDGPAARGPRTAAAEQHSDHANDQAGDSLRSTHPNPPPAAGAKTAAGPAPAKICGDPPLATPRKMNPPSPPPPIAAAMVAVPMVVTAATRIPARMVCAASGSWTCRSSWRSVMPIAIADS